MVPEAPKAEEQESEITAALLIVTLENARSVPIRRDLRILGPKPVKRISIRGH